MSFQNVLRTLKTVKGATSSARPYQEFAEILSEIPNSNTSAPKPLTTTTISLLSKLNPNTLHLILSEPTFKSSECFLFFNFLLKNQSFISFKIDLLAHLTFICRLLRSRKFTDAEQIFKSISVDTHFRSLLLLLKCVVLDPKLKPNCSI